MVSVIEFDNFEATSYLFIFAYVDKFVHFGLYAILCTLLCYETTKSTFVVYAIILLMGVSYGGAIELVQHYFTCRIGEWNDFFANALGGIVGIVGYILVIKKWKILH